MTTDNRIFGEVKGACDLADYITYKFTGSKVAKAGATTFINPSPCCSHNDCFNVDTKKHSWKCYSCGAPHDLKSGDVFHFAERVLGLSRHDALKDIASFAGVPLPDRERPAEPPREKATYEYIAERCLAAPLKGVEWLVSERAIDAEVAQRAAQKGTLGFNDWTSPKVAAGEKMHGGPAVAFIVRSLNPGHIMAVDLRYFDPALNGGVKTTCQGDKQGYGWTSDIKRLLAAETVYITESPINALSIESAKMPGKTAAFAIRGVGNVGNIPLDWLRGKQVIYVPDNDEPGEDGYCVGLKAAWAMHERLTAMDISCLFVDLDEWEVNDVNDILKEEGPERLRKRLFDLEPWIIPGMGSHQGKPRIFLPTYHYSAYEHFRVKRDFTSAFGEKVSTDKDGIETRTPYYKDLAGFRVASISRVSIQGATSTMTGDPDTMPKTLFSVSVQTTRHGSALIRRVVDDEKLHNIDVWKKFGPVWDQSKFLRLVNIMENAAHIGARHAANFVGLCWREGRLVVNEGPDCYFNDPDQQCPYSNMVFPSGTKSDARRVVEAFQATFGKSAGAHLLTWSLGGHLKALLGFWPHTVLQAKKETGKSTLIKKLERAISFTMFSGQSLQTEYRLITSVSHTSHPVGWEEISARKQEIIDKAVALLQENYQYTLNRRGSDMREFLISAPVLLAGEDVPVDGIQGKLVRISLREQGEIIPNDLPVFPVKQWLSYLSELSRQQVTSVFERCLETCTRASRSPVEGGSKRMLSNYAAVMTAWLLLCDFCGTDAKSGSFLVDLITEMNAHIADTSGSRHPWVWILEKLASEIAAGHYDGPWKIDDFGPGGEECLFIRTSDVMHHLSRTTSLRDFWNSLPVKSDRVFKQQLIDAGIVSGEAEKTIGNRRFSRMTALSLKGLEGFGVLMHRVEPS